MGNEAVRWAARQGYRTSTSVVVCAVVVKAGRSRERNRWNGLVRAGGATGRTPVVPVGSGATGGTPVVPVGGGATGGTPVVPVGGGATGGTPVVPVGGPP